MYEPLDAGVRDSDVVVCSCVIVLVEVRKAVADERPACSAWRRYPYGSLVSSPDMEIRGRWVGDCTKIAVRHQDAQ